MYWHTDVLIVFIHKFIRPLLNAMPVAAKVHTYYFYF